MSRVSSSSSSYTQISLRYKGQYARYLCCRLFRSREIAVPMLIVTMLAGPSKFKAPAHWIVTYLAMAGVTLKPLHSYNNIVIFYCCCCLFFVFSIGITCIIYSYLFTCLDCGIAMVLVNSAVNYYSLMICQYSAKESHQSNSE